MAVEETLVSVLSSLGGIYALRKPPEKALPAIVYQRVSRHTHYSHDGTPLMHRDRYQINCLGATYKAMRTLREGVEDALGANVTNFVLSLPLGFEASLPDDLDSDIRASTRDYYIWSQPE